LNKNDLSGFIFLTLNRVYSPFSARRHPVPGAAATTKTLTTLLLTTVTPVLNLSKLFLGLNVCFSAIS